MRSITEILGGAQTLLDISFDIQDVFEEYLTSTHRAFLHTLRIIESHLPQFSSGYRGRGRRPHSDVAILRAFLAKAFFQIETTTALVERLRSDSSLRQICGITTVPSTSTFSRRLNVYANSYLLEYALSSLAEHYHRGKIVGHISRDSTPIPAREKPIHVKKHQKPKRKRGRPKKSEQRPKDKTRLQKQLQQSPGTALQKLNDKCAWGCKKNSQGKIASWKGYKLHLDVTDLGIPVTAVVTGANVHDSQTAIPMEKLTARRITHCYSLMDAGYDAGIIRSFIARSGRVPIVDKNDRRKKQRPPMCPATKQRYKIRSTVERTNSHLKDWLLPKKMMVRGHAKVNFVLMTGVLCLSGIKILQYFYLPREQEPLVA